MNSNAKSADLLMFLKRIIKNLKLSLHLLRIYFPIKINKVNSRIFLKQLVVSDSIDIFRLIDRDRNHLSQFGDDTSQKYLTFEDVVNSIAHPKNPNRLRFAMKDREGVFMGVVNLTPDSGDPHRGEIGYYIGSEFQGKGFTSESVVLLCDFAFTQLGYNTIDAVVHPENKASQRVLEKVGFKKSGKRDKRILFVLTRNNFSSIF